MNDSTLIVEMKRMQLSYKSNHTVSAGGVYRRSGWKIETAVAAERETKKANAVRDGER